jgi:hypothetical protein
MRTCIIIITFLIGSLNVVKGQSSIKRSIPLLEKASKIDSLMESVIKIAPKKDSCFLLTMRYANKSPLIMIENVNKKVIKFGGGNIENEKSLGYFEINGYTVFVTGDNLLDCFFKYTSHNKMFTFFKSAIKGESIPPPYAINSFIMILKHENGMFINATIDAP